MNHDKLPKVVQEVAYLTGAVTRFVLDRLSISKGWEEMPRAVRPASIQYWPEGPAIPTDEPSLSALNAEHLGGLPELNKMHERKVA